MTSQLLLVPHSKILICFHDLFFLVSQSIVWLPGNKKLVMDALSPLNATGSGVTGGEGAIYYWAQLPQGCEDDEKVIEWLLCKFGVCVIPGSSCGMPGV